MKYPFALLLIAVCLFGSSAAPVTRGASIARAESGPVLTPRIVLPGLVRDEPCRTEPLLELVTCGTRDGIRLWAASRTVAQLNAEVSALPPASRVQLATKVLDSNASGPIRTTLATAVDEILATPELGFYVEILAYTTVAIEGDGFFGGCNRVSLSQAAYSSLPPADARGVLMHELFHSFNCVNGGPFGALDEGSAIWIRCYAIPADCDPRASWAETTYGTKLWYRDIEHLPDYPIGGLRNPTQKLLDVYASMSTRDPAHLPWDSEARLSLCFDRYFAGLSRDVDFFEVWLPAQQAATQQMVLDPECRPAG